MGFNTISKYHRADYISLSENELRLDVRNRKRHIQAMIAETCDRLSCNQMIVSKGKDGCISYSPSDGFFEVPTFTNRIVDRVGAGDTMFSGTALCAALHVPVEVMGFIGNVLGAQAVGIVGNRHTIDRVGLFKHIKSLLT
jgi:sugar/nucleoside kinase (ribokinase family)